jgi:hypothetical protein
MLLLVVVATVVVYAAGTTDIESGYEDLLGHAFDC